MLSQNLLLIMCALGMVTAIGIHELFWRLRSHVLLPTSILGVLIAIVPACLVLWFTYGYLMPIFIAPTGSVAVTFAEISGMLTLMIVVPFMVTGLLGLMQSRMFAISWLKAFGLLMTEAAVVTLIMMNTNPFVESIQKALVGEERISKNYFDGLEQARDILSCFVLALLITLLLLEVIAPFVRKYKRIPLLVDHAVWSVSRDDT